MTQFAAVSFDLAHRLVSAATTIKQQEGTMAGVLATNTHEVLALCLKTARTERAPIVLVPLDAMRDVQIMLLAAQDSGLEIEDDVDDLLMDTVDAMQPIPTLGVKVAGTKGRGGVSIEGLNGSSINISGPVIGGDWKA